MRNPARLALLVASVLAAMLLLMFVLRGVDLTLLALMASELRPLPVLLVLVAFALNHGLRIWRWHVLVGTVPLRVNVDVCLLAFLAITLLPLRLGEVVRPALLVRAGVPLAQTIPALAAERLLDIVGLLVLLAITASMLDVQGIDVQGVDVVSVARASALLLAAALAAVLLLAAALGRRLASLPLVGGLLADGADVLRALGADPVRAAKAVVWTAATWLSCVLYVWAALRALPSLPGSLGVATAAWTGIIAALTALPTPGFFGSYEAGAAGALSLFGADLATASAWALGLHTAYILFVAASALPALVQTARQVR